MNQSTNQYQDLYNPKTKKIQYAEARYVPRIDTDNPLITALPPIRESSEIISDCTEYPGFPPADEFQQLKKHELKALLNKLSRSSRVYLPYYATIEESIDRCLTDSYERRSVSEYDEPYYKYILQNHDAMSYQCSEITELSDAPTGFALLGRSGSGKSTGINNVLRKYPRYIIHNPGTLHKFIQIPILYVVMAPNNNFHDLYTAIGQRFDEILGNNGVYKNELGRKGDSLSVKYDKLCNLIRIFHVGLLIIDEIELLDAKRIKEGTLETFMRLANQTGVAIATVGTEDAFNTLFRHDRITRRMGELINSDGYCTSMTKIKNILNILHSYLPVQYTVSDECYQAYYEETEGVIYYIMQLFIGVAIAVSTAKPGKNTCITPELIKNIAKKTLAGKQEKDKHNRLNRIVEDEEYSDATFRHLLGQKENNKEEHEDIPPCGIEIAPTLRNTVKSAIHGFPGNDYTDTEIESALKTVIGKVQEDDASAVIRATFIELAKRKNAKKKRAQKQTQQEKIAVDLDALKSSLTVSTDTNPETIVEIPNFDYGQKGA